MTQENSLVKTDPYAALRFLEFRNFMGVRFFLIFAWSMQFVVIEWEVYQITKDPLSLGIIGLMEIIPAIGFALFAGHIVDQNERKKILLICISFFILISTLLFLLIENKLNYSFSADFVLYSIYFLVFLGGIVRAFIGPSVFALLGSIVPKKLYPNAATWSSSMWQMAAMLGPTLGGFSIGWIGTSYSLLIVAICATIAFIFLTRISKKPFNAKTGESVFDSLKVGLKFVFETKEVLGALTLDMIAVLFGGAVALLPIFAAEILKVDAQGFGFLRAAPAVGAFITMVTIAYFPINKNAGMKLLISIAGFGVCIIIFGLSQWFWLSMFMLFLSGIFDGVSMVVRSTVLQLKTPDNMRGRVSSVNSIFVGSSNELGALESGVAAKLMGVVPSVVFGGIMTISTVIATGIFVPKLRKLDFDEEIKASQK
jgi:MFS family permease